MSIYLYLHVKRRKERERTRRGSKREEGRERRWEGGGGVVAPAITKPPQPLGLKDPHCSSTFLSELQWRKILILAPANTKLRNTLLHKTKEKEGREMHLAYIPPSPHTSSHLQENC